MQKHAGILPAEHIHHRNTDTCHTTRHRNTGRHPHLLQKMFSLHMLFIAHMHPSLTHAAYTCTPSIHTYVPLHTCAQLPMYVYPLHMFTPIQTYTMYTHVLLRIQLPINPHLPHIHRLSFTFPLHVLHYLHIPLHSMHYHPLPFILHKLACSCTHVPPKI